MWRIIWRPVKVPFIEIKVGDQIIPSNAWIQHGFVQNEYDLSKLFLYIFENYFSRNQKIELQRTLGLFEVGDIAFEPEEGTCEDILRGIKWRIEKFLQKENISEI